jgi:hypothetical protein
MIESIQQPEGSSLCGQTCVAMIAGITLEESIEAFGGKRGATRTTDLVNALRKLGINCGDPPLVRIKGQLYPDTCIVKLHFNDRKNTHWTVWHKGKFYDPEAHLMVHLELLDGNEYHPVLGVRQTSYLPIFM